MSKFDTDWTTFPVCPYCGEQDQDWWDGLGCSMGDGDSWEVDCGFCDEPYVVTMSVSTHFSTRFPNKSLHVDQKSGAASGK